ncbi:hypothetical protein [Pseudophaeobacter sp.]|uniref:hypothetical protein n=1 Tax=Pseudophaeobacter sp. TaxID=1971739 RepID=UPI0032973E28
MSMESELRILLEGLGHPVVWGSFKKDVGFPRISLQRISNGTGYTLKGRSGNETARVQVNLYAETSGALIRLAPQVSRLITNHRGASVFRCKELSRRDGSSESGGDVIPLQMLDFQVRYRA